MCDNLAKYSPIAKVYHMINKNVSCRWSTRMSFIPYEECLTPEGAGVVADALGRWQDAISSKAAASLFVGLSFERLADGSLGPAEASCFLRRSSDVAAQPSCISTVEVTFVGAVHMENPASIDLFGVATMSAASCRQHLVRGAQALLAELEVELQRACQSLDDTPKLAALPSADQLLRLAHA